MDRLENDAYEILGVFWNFLPSHCLATVQECTDRPMDYKEYDLYKDSSIGVFAYFFTLMFLPSRYL
jgi:hypothetical protein